jgi:hypothetical protein
MKTGISSGDCIFTPLSIEKKEKPNRQREKKLEKNAFLFFRTHYTDCRYRLFTAPQTRPTVGQDARKVSARIVERRRF